MQPGARRSPDHIVRLNAPAHLAAEVRYRPGLPLVLPNRPAVGHVPLLQLVRAQALIRGPAQRGPARGPALYGDLDNWRVLWGRVISWLRAAQVGEEDVDMRSSPREQHVQLCGLLGLGSI
eukprot:scaffold12626_cov62-Phaeocystis_antarctica.AAC.6